MGSFTMFQICCTSASTGDFGQNSPPLPPPPPPSHELFPATGLGVTSHHGFLRLGESSEAAAGDEVGWNGNMQFRLLGKNPSGSQPGQGWEYT